MKKYNITENDLTTNFFHFTLKDNLYSIEANGLIPKIGKNAKYIEKTKKIFFVEGLDNLLILFDCWINVYFYMPKIPLIYNLGSHFLRQKWFPQIIADVYFKVLDKTKIHRKRSYKIFDKLLDSSILLNLNLEENKDFKYSDIDEIKARNYKKRHLELMGYSKKYSKLESNEMDKWNLHCMSNHNISSDKIKLCYVDGSYELRDIFNYIVYRTNLNLKEICPILYEYSLYKKSSY